LSDYRTSMPTFRAHWSTPLVCTKSFIADSSAGDR
jgi:hypothetical protein